MHISQKLAQARVEGKPTYSFEFFPPKTAQGVCTDLTWTMAN
jgi:methylenetetrahydrofolate reductase (NADPH)